MLAAEEERKANARKKKKGKKAVKQIMSQLFHHQRSMSADRIDKMGLATKKKSAGQSSSAMTEAAKKLIPPSLLNQPLPVVNQNRQNGLSRDKYCKTFSSVARLKC